MSIDERPLNFKEQWLLFRSRIALLLPEPQRSHAVSKTTFITIKIMSSVIPRWFSNVVKIISGGRIDGGFERAPARGSNWTRGQTRN